MHPSNAVRNRLAAETSPYLLQHADNPVDWYPWGDEALDRAAAESKPILLSIGYSACHWCHVMAHESFEDDETAALMNAHYVNIKVDREERPDLDRIYQAAHQLITRRNGGWPLTLFLTPDQIPFFGGTYFPKDARHGLPGFKDLLARVAAYRSEHSEEIASQNSSLVEALQQLLSDAGGPSANELNAGPMRQAREELERSFDTRNGGFGAAPKFPHPTSIELLLHRWAASLNEEKQDQAALKAASFTLLRMCEGGLYDHLGGGFSRYSVDAYWMIPHFEKMLYDNGPLLGLCAELSQATTEHRFLRTATETAAWVMREMQSPDGPYYSSLDADSEGVEGKFYVWKPEEIRDALEADEYQALSARFGLGRPANFEGSWHLHGYLEEPEVAARLGWAESRLETVLDRARQKLFGRRESRIAPARDEKILTSWNALMIKGMASASHHLGEPAYAHSATRAVDFIQATLWHDGRLLATYKDGSARLAAYLDDHAFLIDALLELLQCRWRQSDLDFAIALTEQLLTHFEDGQSGGFYFTADDHETLINRPKPLFDDALPSGNGIATKALLRLGQLLGEQRYLEAAERTLRWAWSAVEESPLGHTALLLALEEWLRPGQTVIVRGSGATLDAWRHRAAGPYSPQRLTLAIPSEVEDLPGLLQGRQPLAATAAYVCAGNFCSAPITTFEDFEQALADSEVKPVRQAAI